VDPETDAGGSSLAVVRNGHIELLGFSSVDRSLRENPFFILATLSYA
jgi:hypothetical protein